MLSASWLNAFKRFPIERRRVRRKKSKRTRRGSRAAVSAMLSVELLEHRNLLSTIGGLKWNDLDANGVRDPGEPGLSGMTIFVDLDHNGSLSDRKSVV